MTLPQTYTVQWAVQYLSAFSLLKQLNLHNSAKKRIFVNTITSYVTSGEALPTISLLLTAYTVSKLGDYVKTCFYADKIILLHNARRVNTTTRGHVFKLFSMQTRDSQPRNSDHSLKLALQSWRWLYYDELLWMPVELAISRQFAQQHYIASRVSHVTLSSKFCMPH